MLACMPNKGGTVTVRLPLHVAQALDRIAARLRVVRGRPQVIEVLATGADTEMDDGDVWERLSNAVIERRSRAARTIARKEQA